MTNRKYTYKFFLAIFFALQSMLLFAEPCFLHKGNAAEKKQKFAAFAPADTLINKNRLSVNLSTTGIGVEFGRRLGERSFLNAHAGILSYHLPFTQDWTAVKVSTKPSVVTSVLALSFDRYIWKKEASVKPFYHQLKWKLGLQYMNNPNVDFSSRMKSDKIMVGNTEFTSDELGVVYTYVHGNHFQPFAALGYDEFFTSKKWSFAVDAGAVYVGDLKVDMEATKMLELTTTQADKIRSNLKYYQVLPYITVRFQYKF